MRQHHIGWTFTGVDEGTDLDELAMLAIEYPAVEFAVLAGSQTGLQPIFPRTGFVERFRREMARRQLPSAIHLCGRYARMAVSNDGRVVGRLTEFVNGFGRVQVNMTAAEQAACAGALESFAQMVPELILQHRDAGWESVPIRGHPRVTYLFDPSGGRGIESIDDWPAPPEGRRVGYAGGIGPHNIERVLAFAARWPDTDLWFDMESNMRDNGLFDTSRVDAVLGKVRSATSERKYEPYEPN